MSGYKDTYRIETWKWGGGRLDDSEFEIVERGFCETKPYVELWVSTPLGKLAMNLPIKKVRSFTEALNAAADGAVASSERWLKKKADEAKGRRDENRAQLEEIAAQLPPGSMKTTVETLIESDQLEAATLFLAAQLRTAGIDIAGGRHV